MSPIPSFCRNLSRIFFGSHDDVVPGSLPPTRVRVEMPPVRAPKVEPVISWPDPPVASCWAKGVAKSLETEPGHWEKTVPFIATREGWIPVPVVDVTHTVYKLRIVALGRNERGPYHTLRGCTLISGVIAYKHYNDYLPNIELHPEDMRVIAAAIEAHPVGQLKEKLEIERQEAERLEKAKAHFETLGCPTPRP